MLSLILAAALAPHAYTDRAIAYPNAGHTVIGATKGLSSAVTSFDSGGHEA
jgi:hypothetical protein